MILRGVTIILSLLIVASISYSYFCHLSKLTLFFRVLEV